MGRKMECPVCGAKMVDNKICKYCGVTREQVLTASNEKAKQARKSGNKENICYTTEAPSDINKVKLSLLVVFLGLFGAANFYVGKYTKAWFNLISTSLSFIFSLLLFIFEKVKLPNLEYVFAILLDFVCWFMAVSLIMWAMDIFGIIFKKFKIPVILGEDEVKVKAIRRGKWKQ
mgnify:FL=1